MFRKLIIPFFVLVTLLWQGCTTESITATAVGAIPINAPVIIEVHNVKKALEQAKSSSVTIPFLELESASALSLLLEEANSAIAKPNNNFNHSFFAFASLSGAMKYDWALVANKENVKGFAGFNSSTVSTYSGTDIYEISKGENTFYACNYLDVLAFSLNKVLIEEVIRQLESGVSLDADAAFKEHHKIASASDPISVFLNLKTLPDYVKVLLPNTRPDWINQLGDWAEVDVYSNDNGLMFNGAIKNSDTTDFYLNCFDKSNAIKMEAADIIPSNTVAAVFYGTDNYLSFVRSYLDYLKKKNLYKNHAKGVKELGVDVEKEFYPHIDGEFGVAYTEPSGDVSASKMGYLKLKDSEEGFKQFTNFAGEAEANYREHLIYKLNKSKLLPLALGRAFKGLNKPYFTLHGDWLFFANDISVLRTAINDWIADKTWAESSSYQNTAGQFDKSANIWAFYKNPGAHQLLTSFLDEKKIKQAKKNKTILTSSDWFSVQIKNVGNANLVNALLIEQPEMTQEASQVWARELSAPLVGKPQFIYNHSTNKREILVQDQSNQIYWLNASGEILWQKQLEGRMIGNAMQVDLFKNNKLQLAFTTDKKFYVLDRLGRDVSPFPISIKGSVTAPLAVFDYDKTRNYRFLVCAGDNVYMYNGEGSIVDGWEFKKSKSIISVRPKHYTLSGRDYIIVAENNGTVNILNRKGQERIEIDKNLKVKENVYMESGSSLAETKLLSINNKGYLKYLFLNNRLDSVDLNLDEEISRFAFDGTRQAFVGGDYFYVKDQNFPFKMDGESAITSEPGIFNVNGKVYYSFTTEENKVFVLNQEGKTLQGFPVYGSSNACVGSFANSGKPFVVVGSSDGSLYLYRITE